MAQPGGITFIVTGTVTPGAIATQLWEFPGVANKSLELVRLDLSFATITSNFTSIEIATATAAATVWTTTTPTPLSASASGATSSFAPKLWATATSTNGTGYAAKMGWYFNLLNGFTYFPVPEERITLAQGTGNFLVVKFTTALPASTAVYSNLVFRELW